ncbi:hypothetical protein A1O1_04241 [Capronia coronata CBS 617.96]|uniref:GDP/GTP exchange factor Sec2 N-terminal domain-containing protein n=1 Tax=Capronia coronata CBS 617.96 TaxID=1182541 RepID=W9YE24_9EURO|nr:uncharacterized protein A1O1_04241 [Capronia coronata CBS 617.96]EXJ91132.1 hypothetical protein A1O1_04241 [Capronia coronata CBS 617.96]
MTTIEASPPDPPKGEEGSPGKSFRTIADPRNASNTDLSRSESASSRHPDLNSEVAALSERLISAINHQTTLDDTLAQTKQELEASRARIAQLEVEAREYEEKLARGDLVPKESVEEQNNKLWAELLEERRQKTQVQQEKRGIESELENLTAALFDEANKMVATANRDRDATEKKLQQLRDKLKDGEAVIASQSEQLAELKELMQQIGPAQDYRRELDSPRVSLAPSSPGVAREDNNLVRLLEAMNLSPAEVEQGEVVPGPSTHLTYLIKPICRTDIPAYEDFRNLVQSSHFRSHNASHAASRAGSGSYGGLNMMGLGSLNNNSNTNLPQTSQPATSKLANSPNLPGSFSPTPDSKGPIQLKDTRFYKRILVEDIEPTLRLDLSPTLSWLNRRSILSALGDSTLIVEPIPEHSMKLYGRFTPCALCGEARKEGENPRTHAMRVREGEGATKWSICMLCLEKVRGVGDLVAYVRMVREGVVKVGDRKDEEDAWEELVRLRERLFWARMAGGVIPAFLPTPKHTPIEDGKMDNADSGEGDDIGKDNTASNAGAGTPPQQAIDQTPDSTPGATQHPESDTGSDQAAQFQLQQGLDESLTTFDNYKEKRMSNHASPRSSSTPPVTPPRQQRHIKRQSSSGGGIGFPKINIPKLPNGFWEGQVNTLR